MVAFIKWIPATRGCIYQRISALSWARFTLQDCGSVRARLLVFYKIAIIPLSMWSVSLSKCSAIITGLNSTPF